MPGMIAIARKSAIQGRAVSYKVQIDGRKVGKVRNGTGETFVVAAGSHVVEVKSGGARSKLVTVDVAEAGYHVLGARPTKAGFLAVVPFAWIGGWFGSVAFEKGSPGIALAMSATLIVGGLGLSRIRGLHLVLAPIQQPAFQPWPAQPYGPPDLSDPTGRTAVWGEAPELPPPPAQ